MKQFFKTTLASILGTLIAMFIAAAGFFFFMLIIVSAFSSEEVVTVSDNSVLEIRLDYSVPERTTYEPSRNFDYFLPEFEKRLGLNEILENLNKAEWDDNIEGIYLNLSNLEGGSYSTLNSIREGLIEFRQSGKFVIAHGNRISQRAYFLGSAADKVFLSPAGELDLRGMQMELMFFKKTLDKLDVEAQIFRSGKYKSAVETFTNEKMSAENREQLDEMLSAIYDDVITKIAEARDLESTDLKNIIDDFKSRDISKLTGMNLLDGIIYYDDLIDSMKSMISLPGNRNLKRITMNKYSMVPGGSSEYSRNRIAVIYANGEIHEGSGDEETIGMENITRELRKVRNNSNVKAVVLRVNSPGGSPLTSEQILHEVKLTNEQIPVVASFGSVAASGGYYIACGAGEIVCERYSITGSIGAFGIIPNLKGLFNDKLGITFDRIQKGKYSGLYNLTEPLNRRERTVIREKIDEIYSTFITHVAEGRNMSEEYVQEIAQGRVWSGLQAKEIGLVDDVGGLNEAIDRAADLAGIDQYRVLEYPAIKDPIEKILELFSSGNSTLFTSIQEESIEELILHTKDYILERGILTRLPVDIYLY